MTKRYKGFVILYNVHANNIHPKPTTINTENNKTEATNKTYIHTTKLKINKMTSTFQILFQVWSSASQPVPFSLPPVLWGLPWHSTADHQQRHLMNLHPQWVWLHRCWGMRLHRLTLFILSCQYVYPKIF